MSGSPSDSLTWRKSSKSQQNNCVEVAVQPDAVFIRDSKDRSGHVLQFSHDDWSAFLAAVKSGEFPS